MKDRLTIIVSAGSGLILTACILYALRHVLRDSASFGTVSVLILVGLAAFIGIMNLLSFSAHLMGIIDRSQPFGLPEGTVRAILTIAFIILVGVLASFLLTNTNRQPFDREPIVMEGLTQAEAQALQQRLSDVGLVVIKSIPATATEPAKADVKFFARQDYRVADDIAKQVLTILSTILAAMIGFYFGARGEGGARTDDPAERSRIIAELNTLTGKEPTMQTIRKAATEKLKVVAQDLNKKTQVEKIIKDLEDIETKIAAARDSAGNLSLPMDKVRAAQTEAKSAIGKLEGLNQDLQKI